MENHNAKNIKAKIEELREKLNEAVNNDVLVTGEILSLSKELDKLLLEFLALEEEERVNHKTRL